MAADNAFTSPWSDAWKERQQMRRAPDDASFWDERSKTFATKDAPSPYFDRFLDLAAVRPGDSVFDMGCGTGACMGCTCKTKNGPKRVCTEGPVFLREEIEW